MKATDNVIKNFAYSDWIKIWEGRWSFLSCSHFSDQYTEELMYGKHPFNDLSVIFSSKGRSSGWMRQSERDRIGSYLSKIVNKNPEKARLFSNNLKAQAKNFLGFINRNENTVCEKNLYKEFWNRLLVYYHAHITIKYVVDYLSPDLLKKYLPKLEAARLAAEPVLNRTEDFMIAFGKLLQKKTKIRHDLLLCMTKVELYKYFDQGKLPKLTVLQKRNKSSAILGYQGKSRVFVGSDVKKVEKILKQKINKKEVKGAVVYAGIAKGVARLVVDPLKVKRFNSGDVLIAGSTRPEYLPLMRKASAFVTDAGGILSHAAIVAREMKKPCVIGTHTATKFFKDGDMVEVDANKGVVRKI